ncbi:GNAT family N-acetyltransferase [Roseomonas sp. PWR1]|uniref:GNAT family N-acetyltransferase n=1 Tax=Roseomonas nitratireducens TaxID=2820810 RepID=A0ABS4AVS9_9PROT|nr:GNAT family N-acetyltransferase [Neoroseomonas nitratireducens]MBP0465482.1 GNAT family N-acetyltransferase [Neoroseomonas nitratireducens]
MRREEIPLALDWAAAEGWNPGLADADCFSAADPEGFLLAELDGVPVGCISAVRTGRDFGFIGFYIVRPAHRGAGHSIALWRAAMARLAGRTIGLDGVVAQQANYRRSGFVLAHRNVRYGAPAPRPPMVSDGPEVVAAADLPFAALAALDRHVFPVARDAFLRTWLAAPGHVALAARGPGGPAGYGVLRPCREGSKIGPLVATDPRAARALFAALLAAAPAGPVFLDMPEPNADAVAMAVAAGMSPAFETARMYAGPDPALPLPAIYGITSFELG